MSDINIKTRHLYIYIAYSRPNGWTDWADFFGDTKHTGLTRVSSIRFLLFEIKRVLVLNSIII